MSAHAKVVSDGHWIVGAKVSGTKVGGVGTPGPFIGRDAYGEHSGPGRRIHGSLPLLQHGYESAEVGGNRTTGERRRFAQRHAGQPHVDRVPPDGKQSRKIGEIGDLAAGRNFLRAEVVSEFRRGRGR